MADNKIQGRAKKFNGSAIDYVSIFNWDDGKCIAQVVPDISGNWQYNYTKNLKVGLTYVADGCEPITHGAYDFLYEYDPLLETILHYDFDGDFLDKSSNALNGIKTGVANFVAGRKAGTQALEFAVGCVRTPQVLPINSDKLTISFWISTSQTATGVVYESSSSNSENNTFGSYVNNYAANSIDSVNRNTSAETHLVTSSLTVDNTYQHVVIVIDRSQNADNEQHIYINNVLTSQTVASLKPNLVGNLANHILYIGQRNASQLPFVGKIQNFRIYNRVLTTDERAQLFNE